MSLSMRTVTRFCWACIRAISASPSIGKAGLAEEAGWEGGRWTGAGADFGGAEIAEALECSEDSRDGVEAEEVLEAHLRVIILTMVG